MRFTRRGLVLIAGAVSLAAVVGCPRPVVTAAPPGPPPPGPAPVADSIRYTTGLFEGCPPEGSGGDPVLNRLKNRDLPAPFHQPMTISQVVDNRPPHAYEMTRDRWKWSRAAQAEAALWENRGAVVECYILRVKQMEPESCNCKDKRRRDYHVWLGQNPDDDRSASMIAEVSPRLLPSHPNWRLRILSRLSKDRAKVRVSGWLMWDQEHPDQVGKTRGTQWEIHPIHRIEVFSGGRWRDLDG
jgi:hypothetical protein